MTVPPKLLETQRWFGNTITQPLREDNHLLISHKEAEKYIASSPALQSHQRIEIYHQQYWWRLLKVLQENFPMVVRLFGYTPFNREIAIPYLCQNPPTHWGLCQLGQTLPEWIHTHYLAEDLELVRVAAQIDAAAQRAFWIGEIPPIAFEQLSEEEILTKKIRLQPSIHLFKLKGDFFSFREELLKKEVDYWNDHPFPEMDFGIYYFVLYRNFKNKVTWETIPYGAYRLLSYLKKGLTFAKACAKIEEEGGEAFEQAQEFMSVWLYKWTQLQWFGD